MTMQDILNAITTVGFPIVACAALFWLNINQGKSNRDTLEKVTEALNNNTNAITRLVERMEK